MKVVSPNDTAHTITLIPRTYDTQALSLKLYNEATQETHNVTNSYVTTDGVMVYTFNYSDFNEGDKYQILLQSGLKTIYRGKLIATSQEPEDYKLTEGAYIYG
jgi:hypothetical protein